MSGAERALAHVQTLVVPAALLGPYDAADPVGLEVSVVRKDAACSLLQAPVGESQCRPLGFQSRAVPFLAENYMLLKKVPSTFLGPGRDVYHL